MPSSRGSSHPRDQTQVSCIAYPFSRVSFQVEPGSPALKVDSLPTKLPGLSPELPYDPAISLLDIYTGKTIIPKDTCAPMFIAALFTIVRTQKQLKCSSQQRNK